MEQGTLPRDDHDYFRQEYGPEVLLLVLAGCILPLLGFPVFSWQEDLASPRGLVGAALVFCLLLWRSRRMGLWRGLRIGRLQMLQGLASLLALTGFNLLLALLPLPGASRLSTLEGLPVPLLYASVAMAAGLEEALYRILLTGGLVAAGTRDKAAMVLSVLVFALAHLGGNPRGAVLALPGGLVLAWLWLRQRNPALNIAVHLGHNLLSLGLASLLA